MQSIDDDVVCEDCIREAARVLELDEHPLVDVERRAAEAAEKSAADWQRYAEGVEAQVGHPPSRRSVRPGRPPVRPAAVAA